MPGIHKVYLVDAASMARACRKLAQDLRDEADMGMPPIGLSANNNQYMEGDTRPTITRAEAAESMDRQAERWEIEARTGIPNFHDRRKIGELL